VKKFLRSVYKVLPFKKYFFILLKKIWQPPESVYRHLFFKGIIQVKLPEKKFFKVKHYGYQVENDIFWTGILGSWEKHSLDIWMRLCKPATVILDIGANTGIYSLIAKSLNKDADVYAFEPVKRVFEKLEMNSRLNNYDIHCIEKAVSNQTGTALIFDTGSEHEYAATLDEQHKNIGLNSSFMIETITLDDFISQQDLKKIDLMKIDVESHEPAVLQGFSEGIKRFKPAILIEILSDDVGKTIFEAVKGLNYLYFSINEKTGARRTDSITRGENFNYLLCNGATAEFLKLNS
jgi:FkbM family methyltransferase